jgi:GMP synthase (glutamine-hydrolysing)
MLILVINNYGQFNHLIRRSIRDKVESKMISNETSPEDIQADGLILGGGPSLDRAGRCREYLDLGVPVLGICLGMQLMGVAFGGKVEPGTLGGYAQVDVEILDQDEILKGLPPRIKTWASHADQVTLIPKDFQRLARSSVCEIEAMRHEKLPLFGVQWHPEVAHTEFGSQLLDNFLALCKR